MAGGPRYFSQHEKWSQMMNRQKPVIDLNPSPLWLAAAHGRLLTRSQDMISPLDEPESVLEIEFEGLTEAEQRAALDAFPCGRRFRLASPRH